MFGKRLRMLRKEKGLTQVELSKSIGVSDRTLGYYETEERFPPQDVLENIANYFNVSIDYLMGRTSKSDTIPPQDLETELEEFKRLVMDSAIPSATGKHVELSEADKQTLIALADAQLGILRKDRT